MRLVDVGVNAQVAQLGATAGRTPLTDVEVVKLTGPTSGLDRLNVKLREGVDPPQNGATGRASRFRGGTP